MREITLTRGVVAVVDDEDFPSLSLVGWFAVRWRDHYYAARHEPVTGKAILMHRAILQAPPAAHVDHRRHPPRIRELEGILADQGRVWFLHGPAEGHDEQAVRAMRAHGPREARLEALEAIAGPLLPLFRERRETWERMHGGGVTAAGTERHRLPMANTITLTAEFPTSALRALIDARNKREEEG